MLRHAHGAQYLTRSVFFFFIAPATTDISTLSLHDALPISSPGEPALTVEQWARRVRARYQMGLIGWIRGERVEQNLHTLADVAAKLEQVATRQPVFQLWWVIGAVIEALQERGLESGQSVTRLLGLRDRQVSRLYAQGDARYYQCATVALLNYPL